MKHFQRDHHALATFEAVPLDVRKPLCAPLVESFRHGQHFPILELLCLSDGRLVRFLERRFEEPPRVLRRQMVKIETEPGAIHFCEPARDLFGRLVRRAVWKIDEPTNVDRFVGGRELARWQSLADKVWPDFGRVDVEAEPTWIEGGYVWTFCEVERVELGGAVTMSLCNRTGPASVSARLPR